MSEPRARIVGHTLNMSRRGILVALDTPKLPSKVTEVGEGVRVAVRVPAQSSAKTCWVDCVGLVVRVEEKEGVPRIALDLKRYHFRRPRTSSREPKTPEPID